jgi:hypothetical protein
LLLLLLPISSLNPLIAAVGHPRPVAAHLLSFCQCCSPLLLRFKPAFLCYELQQLPPHRIVTRGLQATTSRTSSLKNMLQDGWQDHANQVPETQSAQLVHKGCCGMLE